jgi:hypothetical protein
LNPLSSNADSTNERCTWLHATPEYYNYSMQFSISYAGGGIEVKLIQEVLGIDDADEEKAYG